MFNHFFKISNLARKLPKKPKPNHFVVVCFVSVIFLFTAIYALPISKSQPDDTAESNTTENIFDNLFLFRNIKANNVSLKITDPTGVSSNPETALSNQFQYANRNKLSAIAPGDKLDLSYEISNTGTEAVDIRETYYILTFVPQIASDLDFAMFRSVAPTEYIGAYKGTSALASHKLDDDGRLFSFTSDPYILSGSNETIDGAPMTKKSERYMVFDCFAGNESQGETIVIVVTLEYKAHSSDEWEPSITETVILGGRSTTTEYRTNTDVYLSCDIAALDFINEDNPGYVTFTVTDPSGAKTILTYDNFCSPVIGVQRAYVPFHIPDLTGDFTVSISSSKNVICDTKEIIAKVVSSEENTPPDPTMDMNISVPVSFPRFTDNQNQKWVTYSASKNAAGQWEYEKHIHTASLGINFILSPIINAPTATGNTIASGYGINATIDSKVSSSDVFYNVQNVYCLFPEFDYKDYSRKLEIVSQDALTTTWAFKTNEFSHSNSRAHYIPPAYPDGLYTVFATVRDAWTPAGELKGMALAELNIIGSVYDDWYIAQSN